MDPKRKKIYIGLIGVCLVASAIILWSGFHSSTGSVDSNTPVVGVDNSANPTDNSGIDTGSGSTTFGTPQIFPATKEFKTKVLESTGFKKLKPYQNVDPNPLGRPDPFRTY
jgi:hypothetical protein